MIRLPKPSLQIGFAMRLMSLKQKCLQIALRRAVSSVDIQELDNDLITYAGKEHIAKMAAKGLRGELLFATPCIIKKSPALLGYYRLLLGYSQKSFYNTATGFSVFKKCEDDDVLTTIATTNLNEACTELCNASKILFDGIGAELISKNLLHELSLLTLGPQLRGAISNTIGQDGIKSVFQLILAIVETSVVMHDEARGIIVVENAAKRRVTIEFSSDPDIVITEKISEKTTKKIVAIEIKAGADIANIHNRLGEAEKSHQKAKLDGFAECWTIFNVDLDYSVAKKEAPSTNRFYKLSCLLDNSSDEFSDFKDQVVYFTGIPNSN